MKDKKIIPIKFELSKAQTKKYIEWREMLEETTTEPYVGCAGGAYKFIFTMTGLGDIVKVVRSDGQEIDLTDWDNFG